MAEHSLIEWTDATWNPVTGCSVVSPGCTNCYAMRLAGTRLAHHPSRAGLTRDSKAGPVWTGEVRLNEAWLTQPLRWRRPRRIFVCAHGDLFHEAVPDAWIDKVFAVMALAPQHVFQVLTKRPERMRDYLSTRAGDWTTVWPDANPPGSLPISRHKQRLAMRGAGWPDAKIRPSFPLPNVWPGTSVERQQEADERIPHLLATPAAVRWVSAEPLLGPLDGTKWLHRLDWVVAGGESGPGSRPMHPDWLRSLRDQCIAAGVPLFFKQWGDWHPCRSPVIEWSEDDGFSGEIVVLPEADAAPFSAPSRDADIRRAITGRCSQPMARLGKARAGRLLDGIEHNGMPGETE